MSILSDHEIKQLCVPPEPFDQINETLYRELIMHQDIKGWPADHDAQAHLRCEIRQRATTHYDVDASSFKPMISPYHEHLVREVYDSVTKPIGGSIDGVPTMVTIPTNPRKVLSFGQSSYGYDVTLSDKLSLFTNINSSTIDPKNFDERCLVDARVISDHTGSFVMLPPNSYLLGHTVEYFRMPRDVTAIFLAKSTYARAGVSINATPAEAGWEGVLVLEIANLTSLPVKIYVNEGIAQALLFRGSRPCAVSYADRGGKYQGQRGITLPKV